MHHDLTAVTPPSNSTTEVTSDVFGSGLQHSIGGLWRTLVTDQRLWLVRRALLLIERIPGLLSPGARFIPREDESSYTIDVYWSHVDGVSSALLTQENTASDASIYITSLITDRVMPPVWNAAQTPYQFDAFSSERGNALGPDERVMFTTRAEAQMVLGMVMHEIMRLRGEVG